MMKKLLILLAAVSILVLLAVAANAAVGTVVYCMKTDKAPNLEEIDDSWGEPAIHVDKNSPNTDLVKYWQEFIDTCYYQTAGTGPNGRTTIVPEDSDFDMYCMYDDKNIYFAFWTPDYHITGGAGGEESHRGDGIHLWLQPLDTMKDPYSGNGLGRDFSSFDLEAMENNYLYFWDLQFDDWTTGWGCAANNIDEPPVIAQFPGKDELHCIICIPLVNYGLHRGDPHGFEFGITVMRISSISTYDEGYAGWLSWGDTLEEFSTVPKSVNTLIMWDPANGMPGDAPGQETEPDLSGVSSWAKEEVSAGIKAGLVPAELQKNYTTPVTRGQVAQMFINLLEKATGKTVDEIMAEKGVAINENAFTDTKDKAVLAANALGIINGTGNGKFSPDGTLKRAQIAAIINRVAKVMGIGTEGYTHEFTDITDNYKWADSELGWPVYAGIINGVGGGKFNPGGDLTTEQAILITYRGLSALK